MAIHPAMFNFTRVFVVFGISLLERQAMKGAGKDTEDLESLFTVDTKGSRPSIVHHGVVLGRCEVLISEFPSKPIRETGLKRKNHLNVWNSVSMKDCDFEASAKVEMSCCNSLPKCTGKERNWSLVVLIGSMFFRPSRTFTNYTTLYILVFNVPYVQQVNIFHCHVPSCMVHHDFPSFLSRHLELMLSGALHINLEH